MNLVKIELVNQELHQLALQEHNDTVQHIYQVIDYYKDYLENEGYTNVIARITRDRVGMRFKIHGFSADEYINDPLFNCDKYKFGTRYHDLKKTKLNKAITNNFEYLDQSYSGVYKILMGDIPSYEVEHYEGTSRCSMIVNPFEYYIIDGKFIVVIDEKHLENEFIKNNYKKVEK